MWGALHYHEGSGNHEHQPIEEPTCVHGRRILRSQFSEMYSRKFARLVAKTILSASYPMEKPIGTLADPVLLALDTWHAISQVRS